MVRAFDLRRTLVGALVALAVTLTAPRLSEASWYSGSYIFVANQGPAGNAVLVFNPYAAGNVAPVRIIAGGQTGLSSLGQISHMTTDSKGYLYVFYQENGSVGAPAFYAIFVFAPHANGNVAPVRMIAGPQTGIFGVLGMDVDSKGLLYVSTNGLNVRSGRVLIFAPGANGNVSPIAVIIPAPKVKIKNVAGVAVGSSVVYSNAILPVPGTIDEFPLTANGLTSPTCQLGGTHSAISMDSIRGVYTPPFGDLVWARGHKVASPALFAFKGCQSAPVAEIVGSKTGFLDINDIAFDGKGFLYESDSTDNFGNGSIRIFKPSNQKGNVGPDRIIAGPHTQLHMPWSITIGP